VGPGRMDPYLPPKAPCSDLDARRARQGIGPLEGVVVLGVVALLGLLLWPAIMAAIYKG